MVEARFKHELLLCFAAVMVLALEIGCTTAGTTTNSAVTMQYGNTSQTVPDITAATTAALGTGNQEGCFANGLPQPGVPPPGWTHLGTSPKIGECYFADLPPGSIFQYDFFSGQCLNAFQPSDVTGYFTSSGSGVVPTVSVCTLPASGLPPADNHFAISNSSPATITVGSSGLITTFGNPKLLVYTVSGALVGTYTASSVASNGNSATFTFPPSLSYGFFMLAVRNATSATAFKIPSATYYDVGMPTTLTGAFGSDAVDITDEYNYCQWDGHDGVWDCFQSGTDHIPTPLLTQYYANTLKFDTATITVGTQPVAVKAYGSYTHTVRVNIPNEEKDSDKYTGPAKAIVVNQGSNSVSIVSFATNTVTANIPVGTTPTAVAVNSAGTFAYVTNYGNNTVSEVN